MKRVKQEGKCKDSLWIDLVTKIAMKRKEERMFIKNPTQSKDKKNGKDKK